MSPKIARRFRGFPSLPLAVLAAALVAGACSSNNASTNAGVPAHISVITGASVSAVVGSAIGPIVVRVIDADSNPVQGVTVSFTVNGGATLSSASVVTDERGEALTSVTLSHVAGVVTVTAAVSGLSNLTFDETGVADAPATMSVGGGNNQTAPAGSALLDPFTVQVTDQYGNVVSGVTITWTTTRGVLSTASGRTDATGKTATMLTLGPQTGVTTVTASAQIGGSLATVNFTATAT